MAINFELRSVSKSKTAKANLYIRVREGGVSFRFRSPIEVSVSEYGRAYRKGASRMALNAYNSTPEGLNVARQKETAREQITLALSEGVTDCETISKRVQDALFLNDARQTAKDAAQLMESRVIPFIDDFVVRAQEGTVKTARKSDYNSATITYYKNTRRYLSEYFGEDRQDITFNELTGYLADGFVKFLEDNNIMRGTIFHVLDCVTAICRRAWNLGLIAPEKVGVLSLWKIPAPKDDEVKTEVALTKDEVDALWDLSCSGSLGAKDQMVVDVFLGGVYSMQRFSDYSRFSRDMIQEVDGRKFLHIKQDKTENYVDVPLLGRLNEVLRRHDYTFVKMDVKTREWVPKVSYDVMTKHLKKILRDLSNSVPSLRQAYVTPLTSKEQRMEKEFLVLMKKNQKGQIKIGSLEYGTFRRCVRIQVANGCMGTAYLYQRNGKGETTKEKWTLASSHLARRTGITLALEEGILTDDQIRKISGHKTLHSFKKYDKRDKKKQMDNIFDALQAAEKTANNTTLSVAM